MLWENDYLTPFYGPNGEEPTLRCGSREDFVPPAEAMQAYLESIKVRE